MQFRFGEKGIQAVEKLKQDLVLSSRAEVMRLAINFLSWAIDCIESGYEITLTKDKGNFKKMRMPFLELRNLRQENSQEKVVKKKRKSRC